MSARKVPRQRSGWSTALRDDDDDDDSSEPDTSTPSHARLAQGPKVTPDATPTYREGSDWDWNWAGDAVDIGLVPEPKELKFVETPFTLAKRNAKPPRAPALTKSTVRSAPATQGPLRNSNGDSNRDDEVRAVQSSPSKRHESPPVRQPVQAALKTTTTATRSRASATKSEPRTARSSASSAVNKRAPFKPDGCAARDERLCAPVDSPGAVSSKSDSRSVDPRALAPPMSGLRPAKLSAGPPAFAPQSNRKLSPQQKVKVANLSDKAAQQEVQDRGDSRPATESAASRPDLPSSRRSAECCASHVRLTTPSGADIMTACKADQAELFETTLPSSEPDLPAFLRSPTPAFQHLSSQRAIAQPRLPDAAIAQSQSRPVKPVPVKPFVPPSQLKPASLASGAVSVSHSPTAFARSKIQAQTWSTPSAHIETASFYSKPDPASSPIRPLRSAQLPHKQGISPETRKRLDRFKRVGNFGLIAESTLASETARPDSQQQHAGAGPAQNSAARPAASTASARFTIPGLSTPLADGQKKKKQRASSRLAFQPDEPLEAFQARSGLKPFSSIAGGSTYATGSSGSDSPDAQWEGDPVVTPTPSIDYEQTAKRTDRERIVLGATVRSVRPITFSGVQNGSGPSLTSSARAKRGFKRPLPAARADCEADYGTAEADGPAESEDAKRRRLYRSLAL